MQRKSLVTTKHDFDQIALPYLRKVMCTVSASITCLLTSNWPLTLWTDKSCFKLQSLRLLGIPSKLVKLIHVTLYSSKAAVIIKNLITDNFEIGCGVSQSDALSTLLSNLILHVSKVFLKPMKI